MFLRVKGEGHHSLPLRTKLLLPYLPELRNVLRIRHIALRQGDSLLAELSDELFELTPIELLCWK